MTKSFFISFEGVEGCGKSTQIELLREHLDRADFDVLSLREPGGTDIGESIRAVLLDSKSEGIDKWTELFLYGACRTELVDKVLRPALASGKVVLCDRFTDSTIAYQGFGRGLSMNSVTSMNRMAAHDLAPDLTFLLDCNPSVGLERAFERMRNKSGNSEDRFEREPMDFHRRVRSGFLKIADTEPDRVKVIDAEKPVDEIQREIRDIVDRYLKAL